MSTEVRDVIVIGSGPAGYTAALYTARASLRPLVFEGSVTAGGALMNTTEVENFPGFPDGVLGPDLMDHIRRQAERFGAELVPDDVLSVDLTGDIKTVTDSAGTVHLAKAVILAMGSKYRELGLEREKELSGHGVRALAREAGLSSSSLSRYLSGQTVPPWTAVIALCRLVKRDPRPLRPVWERASNSLAAPRYPMISLRSCV